VETREGRRRFVEAYPNIKVWIVEVHKQW